MGTGMSMSIQDQDQDRCMLEREEERDCLLMPVVLARLKRMMYFGGIFRLLSGFLQASGNWQTSLMRFASHASHDVPNRAYHRSENSRDLILVSRISHAPNQR